MHGVARRSSFRWMLALASAAAPGVALGQNASRHNILIFVADGLRHEAVDAANTPTMFALRKGGVDFVNSHSLFPTVTTPNASAIATGHYLGDSGIFGNTMFLGFNDGETIWKSLHDMENNSDVLNVNTHFGGRLTGEESLISVTRKAGYNTAIVGKLGPAIVQDIALMNADITQEKIGTVFIDDGTGWGTSGGKPASPPLRKDVAEKIAGDPYFIKEYFEDERPAGTPPTEPRGNNGVAGTRVANVRQQKYLVDTVTRAVLPTFADPAGNKKPFVMVYWSRDPDGTQHNAGDSNGKIVPGVDSKTVRKAFRNADDNLKQIMDYLAVTADPNEPSKKLSETTNIFLTSDHGFGTVSRKQLDFQNSGWDTFATRQVYTENSAGHTPEGYVSIDLAHDLGMALYDGTGVDRELSRNGKTVYHKLRIESTAEVKAEHPQDGAAFFGGGTVTKEGTDIRFMTAPAGVFVAVYFPSLLGKPGGTTETADLAKKITASFASKPYASGIWVDTDRFGEIPGALSLNDINFKGVSRIQPPALMLGLRTFSSDPQRPLMTGVQLADTGNTQGLGTHGSFGRHDTYNCMMAIGPDFKKTFVDPDPVSNVDIAVTLAETLGIDLPSLGKGKLHGRVMAEALAGGPAPKGTTQLRKESKPSPTGEVTVMLHQIYKDAAGNEYQYFDVGGFVGRAVGLDK